MVVLSRLQERKVAELLLVARYLPAALADELLDTLVDVWACSNNLILQQPLAISLIT